MGRPPPARITAMAVSGVVTFCGASVLARHVDQGIPFWHTRAASHAVVKLHTVPRRPGATP